MNRITVFFDKINKGLDDIGERLEGKTISFNANILGSLLFIIFSSVFIFIMPEQIKITGSSAINAQTFPLLLLRIILFCSIFIFVKEVIKIIAKKKTEKVTVEILTELRALLIFIILLAYFFTIKLLGFIVSSMIFGIAMTFYFRVRKWHYYLIVLASAVIIGLVFREALHVRLP
ncbi:tripartite tricarboxylate transporter TctB family protein [Treponema parvum]|uniref:tripartite tricarboxylate transporter TctB family protein n=1 Tax=Treponema parvum TaxID=138851 RepID=UPI001AEC1276|nr:tripartite tricarboxylate transporter TctB family protein [Treponema parvum]QTQ15386.1 tripartite tricarboxylate transporter TctB family protein [Treponema parvum]